MYDSLLYKREYLIGENIILNIPTVGDAIDAGIWYNRILDMFTAMPIDFMVPLDDMGIDFSEIDDWQLFLLLFSSAKNGMGVGIRSDLLFKNIDLMDFQMAQKDGTDDVVLINPTTSLVFDKLLYRHISAAVCTIFGRKKDRRRPANEDARLYMIEVERRKMKRRNRKRHKPELESLIVAMVNTEQFKYNFRTVRELTIYQFNESVKQILTKVDYEHRMHGIYSGTLDAKSLSDKELNWLIHD